MTGQIQGNPGLVIHTQVLRQFGLAHIQTYHQNLFIQKRQAQSQIDGHKGFTLSPHRGGNQQHFLMIGTQYKQQIGTQQAIHLR